MSAAPTITLQQQLACAKRELALRQRVYPTFRKMSEEQKAYELAAMHAIVATLEAMSQGNAYQLTLLQES